MTDDLSSAHDPHLVRLGPEHLEMILAVHGGSPHVQEDVEAALERIHPATMAAEGPLHDMGAISIVNSDSQGWGGLARRSGGPGSLPTP